MELMITVFKTEIIECLLKIDESKETHMVVSFVEYDRIDLLKIVYSATDAFLKITDVIDQAARNGSLECLEYLSEMGACCTTDAMDDASSNGHLDIVKWLHINRKEGCTTKAMDEAALRGNLETVKWLHRNRQEGCTTHAMDYAAERGHFDIIKWLHSKRTEGCTTAAMDSSAKNGRLEIIKWLRSNRSEGCDSALLLATISLEFKVVKFLVQNGLGLNRLQEAFEFPYPVYHMLEQRYLGLAIKECLHSKLVEDS